MHIIDWYQWLLHTSFFPDFQYIPHTVSEILDFKQEYRFISLKTWLQSSWWLLNRQTELSAKHDTFILLPLTLFIYARCMRRLRVLFQIRYIACFPPFFYNYHCITKFERKKSELHQIASIYILSIYAISLNLVPLLSCLNYSINYGIAVSDYHSSLLISGTRRRRDIDR